MSEELETKPDPLARQSDLAILRAEQKSEHWKTRVLVVGLQALSNISKLGLLVGFLHAYGWWPW